MTNTQTFLDATKANIQAFILTKSTYMAAGTSTTVATAGQTSLVSEVHREAIQESTTGVSDVVVSLFLGSTDANTYDLAEVGAFDASSDGNMMARGTFTPVTKDNTKDIWIDIEEQIDVTQ